MHIGILGAATWGVAVARMLAESSHAVTVWSALPQEIHDLSKTRRHPNLPGMEIPASIRFTDDLAAACTGNELLVFAVPSVFVRQTAEKAAPFIARGQIIADLAKGIEPDTLLTLTEVIRDAVRRKTGRDDVRLVALSGPTHAEEVALQLPTAIVSASEDREAASFVQRAFTSAYMRVYTSEDCKGVELCGALKNIVALAAGISTGLGYGANLKAVIITRGLVEITRLGLAMGCAEQTFYGLAGIGDMIVTATSEHSRNNRAGMLIGQGYPAQEAAKRVGMVVEGIFALPAAMRLSERYQVELPIISAVNAVVSGETTPLDAVRELMNRTQGTEFPTR